MSFLRISVGTVAVSTMKMVMNVSRSAAVQRAYSQISFGLVKRLQLNPNLWFVHCCHVAADGFDECLIPVNYKQAGFIRDDDLYTALVGPMARGVTITSLMDCCHSGTVLDLPYQFVANGVGQAQMAMPASFNMAHLQKLVAKFHESMKAKRNEIMKREFKEFADAMLLPGEGCNGDDVVQFFKNGFQTKYKDQGLYLTYNECAKLLGEWNSEFPKASVTPKGWFMGFHINPSLVRPTFRTYGM
jgi:Caspase domain